MSETTRRGVLLAPVAAAAAAVMTRLSPGSEKQALRPGAIRERIEYAFPIPIPKQEAWEKASVIERLRLIDAMAINTLAREGKVQEPGTISVLYMARPEIDQSVQRQYPWLFEPFQSRRDHFDRCFSSVKFRWAASSRKTFELPSANLDEEQWLRAKRNWVSVECETCTYWVINRKDASKAYVAPSGGVWVVGWFGKRFQRIGFFPAWEGQDELLRTLLHKVFPDGTTANEAYRWSYAPTLI